MIAIKNSPVTGKKSTSLSPYIDKLFDQGYISFEDNGDILISPDAIEAIERIEQLGGGETAVKQWKNETDYHTRSLAETAMFRFKTICGDKLISRSDANQNTETTIKINILNKITHLGMPNSYPVQ